MDAFDKSMIDFWEIHSHFDSVMSHLAFKRKRANSSWYDQVDGLQIEGAPTRDGLRFSFEEFATSYLESNLTLPYTSSEVDVFTAITRHLKHFHSSYEKTWISRVRHVWPTSRF